MPISRLENFLRSPKGTVIYVDPNSFDATDSFENRGDSATRPFKTIQRALIEASRFSYQFGFDNDLNDRTTIFVSSGTHYIDNRPGFSITNNSGNAVTKKRTGITTWEIDNLNEFTENSNFNIFDANNDLYKFNSVEGGVILPRGTSIVGLDLRKTKIRPLFVPDPLDSDIDRSGIFKVTGNCYFTSFTFFDADLAIGAYKDYTNKLVVPKFSHHKLTTFAYADGINKVRLGLEQTDLTDLQMYYYKIAKAYGSTSGRDIPDFPTNQDISPVIDEYRIVGVLEENLIGISSIRSGDGLGGGIKSEITVTTKNLISNLEAPHNLSENTPILISGIKVDAESYNGSFTVKSIVGPNTFTYTASSIPNNELPDSNQIDTAIIKVESDATSSSSPYIFNCSLRSSYGMCGLWADGSKADGFKSIVVAQFTGISLQKDDNAFLIYSKDNKNYLKSGDLSQSSLDKPLHTNSYSIYDPEYENFHIKASNNSFIQCVSIFAIGFSNQFITETGGDMSITNSNSNFGALALQSYGFRNKSFDRDDVGYITNVIPPREIALRELEINWVPIDVELTSNGTNSTDKFLYLYGYNDINNPPSHKIDGYRIGAKVDDTLNLVIEDEIYTSPILMQSNNMGGTLYSAYKNHKIQRAGGVNSISNNTGNIVLTESHQIKTGEKVRVFSDTGEVPDGLENNKVYYAIRINSSVIRLAYNYNDAIANIHINGISNNGGVISIISSVTDKLPGEVGHPIQWDADSNNWYLISSRGSSNEIYNKIIDLGVEGLGNSTTESTFSRYVDTRTTEDRLYKIRYVIPKEYSNIREPEIGFVLQETKTVGVTAASIDSNTELTVKDQRNEKIINAISAGSIVNNTQTVTVKTELPHRLFEGDNVLISNVKSSFNSDATGITSTFNGSYEVLSVSDSRTFTYKISGVSTNPGVFINDTQNRTSSTVSSLPTVSREEFKNSFVVYRVDKIKPHVPATNILGDNGQDGVYHITLISSNVRTKDSIGYGLSERTYNQDVRNLYPQVDRDNFDSNPRSSVSYADHLVPGKVITNDKRNSLTRETIETLLQNNKIGFNITDITLSGVGNTTITIQTDIEHKLNSIKRINLTNTGSGHSGNYYGAVVTFEGNPTDAVCNYSTDSGEVLEDTIEFIDAGSAFTVGQAIGIGTLGATANVIRVHSNISDGLQLSGFFQDEFNDVFKIIDVPDSTTIVLESTKELPLYIENTNSRIPFGFLASKGIEISSFDFSDITTGIVTVTTSESHGLNEGNSFKIEGSGSTIYDSTFIVNNVISLNEFNFNVGQVDVIPTSNSGTLFKKFISPNGKSTGKTGENLENRMNFIYSGISTASVYGVSEDQNIIQFKNNYSGFKRGDYIHINGEIIRLVQRDTSIVEDDTFICQRGMFGTIKKEILEDSRIDKIKILPVELRRPSFMRASGHTFEYLGYGPGNYSTSVPQKQSRKLSDDEILVSQSRKIYGGTVVYSGMNDLGEFYYGAKRVSSVTGQETIIEAPVISFTGDDIDGTDDPSKLSGIFDNILVRQKITVEGGENGTETSMFYGPVKFLNSITFDGDLASKSLTLGKLKKKFTVNDKTGINLGSISYANASSSYIGEILLPVGWRRWGLISTSADGWDIGVDNLTAGSINTDSLSINGVSFNGNSIGALSIENLKVTGISTFEGRIFGDSQSEILDFGNTLSVSNNSSLGVSTSYIRGNGRVIDIASTPTSEYSLRISRESGIENTKSQILHKGTNSLELRSENNEGSIVLTNSGISSLSLLSSTQGGFVQVSRSINQGGTGGAHLSIINPNTNINSDAVISWKSGQYNQYWFSGVNASDNSWNIAVSGVGVGLFNQNFTSNNVLLGITTSGILKGNIIRTSTQKVKSGIATDIRIPTEKAIVDYVDNNYIKKPPALGNSFVVLHVASGGVTTLSGADSVPGGYPTSGVGYDSTGNSENIYQTTLFKTVSEALDFASGSYIPLGAELIISVHNQITSNEAGPLMISNSWSPVVVAGARGATTSPKIKIDTNSFIKANSRFTQFDFNMLSAGVIFQDIDIDITAANEDNLFLTFNGGFGVNKRDVNINWKNCKAGKLYANATASYGEKIQFRSSFEPSTIEPNRYISTNVFKASGASSTNISIMDQVGGLAGQGVDLIFDFLSSTYGDSGKNTFGFRFTHDFTNPVTLKLLGIGGRGNCTISSRIGPNIAWDFTNKDWNMSSFYTGFHKRFNVCSQAFKSLNYSNVGSGNNYNISASTAQSIKDSGGIEFENGARLWVSGGESGPFSLYTQLSGQTVKGISMPISLINLASNPKDAYLYT